MNILNTLTTCPCCSGALLHHVGNHREYWFCRHCWQEIPGLKVERHQQKQLTKIINLSPNLLRLTPQLTVS